jgi:hypothetical protein
VQPFRNPCDRVKGGAARGVTPRGGVELRSCGTSRWTSLFVNLGLSFPILNSLFLIRFDNTHLP